MLIPWLILFWTSTLAVRTTSPTLLWASGLGVLAVVLNGLIAWSTTFSFIFVIGLFHHFRDLFLHLKPLQRIEKKEPHELMPGACFVLDRPLVNGRSDIHLRHRRWCIRGPDLASGTWVRVVSVDEDSLTVEPHAL